MKPLSDEQIRILKAAHERRFGENESGRYVIAADYLNEIERPTAFRHNSPYLHDHRPDRRERERLMKRGMLKLRVEGEDVWWEPSARGYEALHQAGVRL